MTILQINTMYAVGSTGKIVLELHDICKKNDIKCISAYRNLQTDVKYADSIAISSKFDNKLHNLLSRLTMYKGFFSIISTLIFIHKVKKISPDIVHLHNLHGSYINLPILFRYLKKSKVKVIWTLHDCWPITAICSHFTIAKCKKWKTGCHSCVQRHKYSSSIFDFSSFLWKKKRKLFTSLADLTIITPSKWMNKIACQSYLSRCKINTIYNGIDLSVFKPTKSDFREKNGLQDKKIILGVAFHWDNSKGLDVFCDLAEKLPRNYAVVMVGTDDYIDSLLPKGVISIHRTNNQAELAEIYSAADVFVNPTREEVLGLVNVEALACGTPVITFNTGGSPECIDETCGVVIDSDNSADMITSVQNMIRDMPFSSEDCIKRAKRFDKNTMLNAYLSLYRIEEPK